MSKIYLEILDPDRLKVFNKLESFKKIGVLAGGTAIALQIKHRKSYDFDIFLRESLSSYLRERVKKVFGLGTRFLRDETNQIDITTPENIKVTFVKHAYPYLYKVVKTGSINIFDLHDLATNKAFTIGKRGVWRDYVDLYFLIKLSHANFEEIIKEAEDRFGADFNSKLFLQQLVYLDDISDFTIDYISKKTNKNEVADYFEQLTKRYLRKTLR